MYRFLLGLTVGYLTMTEKGREISNKINADVNFFLKKEGVIEPTKTTRPPEPVEPHDKPKEQCSTDESNNE